MSDIGSVFIPKRISLLLQSIYTDKVTVICAPDGAGKTTLLRSFISRTRPRGMSVHYITEVESTGRCFSQISEIITGEALSEPFSDKEYLTLRRRFSENKARSGGRELLIAVDCSCSADVLLGNKRTAQLLAECSGAGFVFVCTELHKYHQDLAEKLGFTVIDKTAISMTRDETEEYARRCKITADADAIYRECEGGFLGTRLCFLLAASGEEYSGISTVAKLVRAMFANCSKRMFGAAAVASIFKGVPSEYCKDLLSFNTITDYFGADLLNEDAVFEELSKLHKIIPLTDMNRRRHTVKLHPILRQAVYRIFKTFPDGVQHDMRICFGREYRREQKDFAAICEFLLAGEYELASEIHNNERISYLMIEKSSAVLRNFIMSCPLDCKPAMPRLLRASAMLMRTDLKPVIRERCSEIIKYVNSSRDYAVSERRALLSYAYALMANGDMYELDKMGTNIRRGYDLFRGKRVYDSLAFAWTMYSPTVFFLLHRKGRSVRTETTQFTNYQRMYAEMLDHGKYTELIFTGELKYARGDLNGALELLSRAASLCSGRSNVAARLTAMYCAAKCCLYLGQYERLFDYAGSILRIERTYSSREEGRCARLMTGLLRTLGGGDIDNDAWYAVCADETDPVMNRFTAPYYAMIKLEFLISGGDYAAATHRAEEFIETARGADNQAAEIKLRLIVAKAYIETGDWKKAAEYAAEALESAKGDELTAIPAEFFVLCPDFLTQIYTLLPSELQPFADEVQALAMKFLRGVETVRTYEITYMQGESFADSGNHDCPAPLRRLMRSTDDLRQQLNLTPQAYAYAILAASGAANDEIGEIFGVSCDSVKSSLKRTYSALGIKKRRELAGKVPKLR